MILVADLATAKLPHIVGFAAFHRVIEEAELRNLAVEPAHQRQGVARSLVRMGIRKLQESGGRRIFLEVRASNHPALALYASLGFRLHSTRKDYYQDPVEDALLMELDIRG
jgi:ribosomal-protein-alanine N-acetyltransferase